jgi:plasmid stability protein
MHNTSVLEPDDAMNLSIKNVPEELVRALKERAKRNHRSLQGEVLEALERSVDTRTKLTVDEVAERVRRLDLPKVDEAAEIVRAMRDSRYT